jgi:penicillin-binding protein 2
MDWLKLRGRPRSGNPESRIRKRRPLRPGEIAHGLYEVPVSVGAAYRRRVGLVTAAVLALFGAVWVRLIDLQMVRGADFRWRSETMVRKEQALATNRGAIRARGGEELAVDEPTFDIALEYPFLSADRSWVRRQARLRHATAEDILERMDRTWSGLASVSASAESDLRAAGAEIVRRVEAIRGRAAEWVHTVREETLAYPILEDVDLALVEAVLERRDEWVGVELQVRSRRRYPQGVAAAHVVGYLLPINERQLAAYHQDYGGDERRSYQVGETIGAGGIEWGRNFDLRGRRGWAQHLVNVRGDVQQTLEREAPEPGSDVSLTIDLGIQRPAEAALARACARAAAEAAATAPAAAEPQTRPAPCRPPGGAAVVLDVHTGAVLALASFPTFDPAAVRRQYAELARDPGRPLENRAIAAHYPAGSVFKVVDSIAALETGAITPESEFFCDGVMTVSGRRFGCEGRHGDIPFITALAKSCNVYFYSVGLKVGQPNLLAWAYRLGFGRKTEIELPGEVPGILPAVNGYQGSTCNLAIGQGQLAVTPLQVAVMMAEVANGGRRIRPTIIKGAGVRGQGPGTDEPVGAVADTRLPIKDTTLDALRGALRAVVVSGTARNGHLDDMVPSAGKTGTAQVEGRQPHAWYAGYAPADEPQIAFAVIIEHGGHGGEAAVPVAREILRAYVGR